MFRYVYEESLEETPNLNDLTGEAIGEMANADNLSHAGVKFKLYHPERRVHKQFLETVFPH
ncbi:hypothetical protein F2Q69_00019233 [Brassica cretica]|uniref:Uncharacterized protein n=1 Tax=Brassica cretica TaxID=69181 RepID=A0A8S9QIS5_BRACR|nr:hypothetical protein F2Q69_00019233 [Brassica cretica]